PLAVVSQSGQQGELSGISQQGGDMLLDLQGLRTAGPPLYWRLPPHYEGNKMLSYGGLLSYDVIFYADDGVGLANHEPQILMRGGSLRKLVIYRDVVAPGNGIWTRHNIPLTEFSWRYFNSVSSQPVSHADFLSVLSSLQYVLVKTSYGTGLTHSRSKAPIEKNLTCRQRGPEQLEANPGGGGLLPLPSGPPRKPDHQDCRRSSTLEFLGVGPRGRRCSTLLLAYGHHNPAVGYCFRALNFSSRLRGTSSIITRDEEKSFWAVMDAG
ncbi:hypothetical protein CRUP_025638, partial [Coryphaenoides rupestris]